MCLQAGYSRIAHVVRFVRVTSGRAARDRAEGRLVFSILQGLSHREGENDWILPHGSFMPAFSCSRLFFLPESRDGFMDKAKKEGERV